MSGATRPIDLSRHPRVDLPRDETLFLEGENSRELYVLLAGSLGVYRDEVQIATIDETLSLVGEVSALTGEPRGATVRAIQSSRLVRVDDPETLFHEYPQMGAKLARLLARRLSDMNTRFVDLKNVFYRVGPSHERREKPVTAPEPMATVVPSPPKPGASRDFGDLTVVRPMSFGTDDSADETLEALASLLDFNPDVT